MRVSVWCSIPSAASTGRIVRHTIACPMLNSPSVPRSEISITSGIWYGTASEASALGSVANPLVCISTTPRIPPIQAPQTMPTASSSRVQTSVVNAVSACSAAISGVSTLSGT